MVQQVVVNLTKKTKRIFEFIFVFLIVVFSIVVFIFRDEIGEIGNVGYAGLFLLCLLANSTVLLPAPSLMIAASCALIMNPYMVALFAALGSSLGEFVGYAFGSVSKDLSPKFQRIVSKITGKIKNQTLLVFILAVLPLPLFDIVGIYSGGSRMNLLKFSISCFVGKFIKMLVYSRMYDILGWVTALI